MKILKKIGILILIVALFYILTGESDYKKAERLLRKGNYEEALSVYEFLAEKSSYKDSTEKIAECKYRIAGVALNNKDYSKAYDIYCELNDYKDSVENSMKAEYALANQYLADNDYVPAYKTFIKLGNYEQSQELAKKCASFMMDNASIGDTVLFGTYEQDGDEENGLEPIEWTVLAKDGDYTLLVSKYILEKRIFDESSFHWEDSDLREWLNTGFYQNSFNAEEQANIQLILTSENTSDKVFCLSAKEAKGLFSLGDSSRIASTTAALLSNEFGGDEYWWTRSVSTTTKREGVVPVSNSGKVLSDDGLEPNHTKVGVRPVICITSSGTIEEAKNMRIFGYAYDSNIDLNEPNMRVSSSNSGSSGKCYVCNGTGYVKYYYGSSDLEAWLSGHDSYTIGKCTSCGGKGY